MVILIGGVSCTGKTVMAQKLLEKYKIPYLSIDHKYQGKGYGKIALGKVIEEMKNFKDCNEIFLSFDPRNQIGKRLYESFNFKDTGKIIDGELLYSLNFK